MAIGNIPFLNASLGKNYGLPQGLGQINPNQYQHRPQTQQAPYHQGLGIPSTEDMEKALAYLQGGEAVSNPFSIDASQSVSAPQGINKAGWEGFELPTNNGTGDLQPNTITDKQGKNLYLFG